MYPTIPLGPGSYYREVTCSEQPLHDVDNVNACDGLGVLGQHESARLCERRGRQVCERPDLTFHGDLVIHLARDLNREFWLFEGSVGDEVDFIVGLGMSKIADLIAASPQLPIHNRLQCSLQLELRREGNSIG